MNWRIVSLPLIVLGVLLYHLAQKSMPKHINPLLALTAAYALGCVLSLAILALGGEMKEGWALLRNQDWMPIVALGLSLLPVELGFLYAYRTGWPISTTSITVGPFIAISLALIGLFWYHETLTLTKIMGIGLCVIGVICVNLE
jgi:drug/metabolite transporter (DMT)-like permease